MLLKETASGQLVEVLNLTELLNPREARAQVQYQEGEDAYQPAYVRKDQLLFPSGEHLPRCWCDSHYRDRELQHH